MRRAKPTTIRQRKALGPSNYRAIRSAYNARPIYSTHYPRKIHRRLKSPNYGKRLAARLGLRPDLRIKRQINASRQVINQHLFKRPVRKVTGNVLRLAVHPNECTRRKNYKKTMMKALARQALRSAGAGSINKWRKRLSRKNPRTRLNC